MDKLFHEPSPTAPVEEWINFLGQQLSDMYQNAANREQVCMIHVFGVKYAPVITRMRITPREIIAVSGLNPSYATEISKGVKLARYVTLKDGLSF